MVPRRRGPRLPPDGYPQTGISGCIYQPAGRARQAPHPTRRLTGAAMLTVRDLRVTYAGAILGLRRVSLDVAAGSVVAVGVVQAPEGRRIFERLTVAENLRIGGFRQRDAIARVRARQLVHELFPILYEKRDQRAGLLSGDQQQMLAIGRALMAQPR